jgi:hypothetical protein
MSCPGSPETLTSRHFGYAVTASKAVALSGEIALETITCTSAPFLAVVFSRPRSAWAISQCSSIDD